VSINPTFSEISEIADNDRITDYVKNGGKVFVSGADNADLIEKLLDCTLEGRTEEKNIYIAAEKEYEKYSLISTKNIRFPISVQRL